MTPLKPSNPLTRSRAVPICAFVAATLTLGVSTLNTVSLRAQPSVGSEGLRADVEAQYEVTPIPGGVGLLPRDSSRGFALLELRGDTVVLDGNPQPQSAEALAANLGADAAVIIRLMYLDAATQRDVLGLPALSASESAEPVPDGRPVVPAAPLEPVVEPDTPDSGTSCRPPGHRGLRRS